MDDLVWVVGKELRFVRRNGKSMLQQMWLGYHPAKKDQIEGFSSSRHEWRDVPFVGEEPRIEHGNKY